MVRCADTMVINGPRMATVAGVIAVVLYIKTTREVRER